jgi:hypothetical protein
MKPDEMIRARMVGTGKLIVIFQDLEEPGRPQAMFADEFDKQFPRDEPAPSFLLNDARKFDDGIEWECRKCRILQDPKRGRFKVTNHNGDDLGEWCEDCSKELTS